MSETQSHLSSYGSIYNLGHRALAELFNGNVVIEEKIDGSQFSMARMGGELLLRSKGKQIFVDEPEGMFSKGVAVAKTLDLRDSWVYRCEYLRTNCHNSLEYERAPERSLVLFDVMTAPETYLDPVEKLKEARRIGIEVTPLISYGGWTAERFADQLEQIMAHKPLLGGPMIEGVVIKNYERFGPDKKILMAKAVREDFKEIHRRTWTGNNPTPADFVEGLINDYRTEARWHKAIQHLRDEGKLVNEPKDIGPLIREVMEDVLKECRQEIADQLFDHFWGKISRGVIKGFPEFYKAQLMKGQP